MLKFLQYLRSGLLACAIFFALPILSKAQDWKQIGKLMARYPGGTYAIEANMQYGYAVSVSGNYAVVGAHQDSYNEVGADPLFWGGSAYVLFNDAGEWKPVKKLAAPVRTTSGMYGFSVAISGDYLAVSEPFERLDGIPGGSVYIYKKDQGGTGNWGLLKRVQARVREAHAAFGYRIAMSGDHLVVTYRWDDLDANDANAVNSAGSAYVFEKDLGGTDNWGLVKKITANVRAAGAQFGNAVAIDGDYVVIGADGEQKNSSEANALPYAGAAFVFKKDQGGTNNWGQVKKLTPAVRAADDYFGSSVGVSGNQIIVGALFDDEDVNELNFVKDAGAAYLFGKDAGGTDNWGQVRKLTADNRIFEAQFGEFSAISGDFAVVGSRRANVDANGSNYMYESGAAFLFERNSGGFDAWGLSKRLFAPVRAASENFGIAVALDGRNLFVSSLGVYKEAGEPVVDAPGAVYVFKQDPPLPVTLASFKVSKVENQAFLQWTTSAETNTSHFEIQKSLNAKDWTAIGTREAAKESNSLLHYTHWDSQLAAGNVYYRLKMVDQDGTFAYSSIRNLLGENGAELVAFPNPVTEKIFIKTTDSNQIAAVEIRNTAGQLVHETVKIDGEGISVGKLAPGTYIIQIRNADGTSVARKITVSR